MAHKHLKGLNALRFFAASLVLFDHGRHHLNEMSIPFGEDLLILHQGKVAVDFFFLLSGFLISYLAIIEINKSGGINYKFFYVRRILRIMPLYYLALAIFLILLGVFVPILLNENRLGFPPLEGGLLFLFMLPNFVKPIWDTTAGGINILWSIGVEEQFYLLFPFLMYFVNRTKKKLLLIVIVLITYFSFYWIMQYNIFDIEDTTVKIFRSLKFHYMLIGIFLALICHKYINGDNKFINKIIDNNVFQISIFSIVLIKLCFSIKLNLIINDLFSGIIFAILILVVSHRTKGVFFNNKFKILSYFGIISYGIYLLHPIVSYFLRFLIVKNNLASFFISKYPILYIIALLLVTLFIANLSYKFFELKFLRLKERFR